VTTEQQTFAFTSGGQRPSAVQMAPRRNKVIEAGAGTGKTTAIVAEVLKLLLGGEEIAPERIILVTFTEKAAGEIADRIERQVLVDSSENGVAGIGKQQSVAVGCRAGRG